MVDTLTLVQLAINGLAQYTVFVIGTTVGQTLVSPITELGTGLPMCTCGSSQGAIEALNVAYRKSVLEAGNGGNIPFLLTYQAGQDKIMILWIVGGVILVLIYY